MMKRILLTFLMLMLTGLTACLQVGDGRETGSNESNVDVSEEALTTRLSNGVPLTGLSGTSGSSTFFTLTVPAGATNLKFTLGTGTSSSNDADLYVRFGAAPTTSTYDCVSDNVGNTEACSIATAQAGTYNVLVYGYTAYSGVTLTGSFTAPPGSSALTNGVPVTGLSGTTGSSTFFTLTVPAGATNLKFTLGTGTSSSNDADLYVRFGSAPTTSTYDCVSDNVGNTESCTIPTAHAGTYKVLVYGYTAYSGVALTGSYSTGSTGGGGPGAAISVHLTLGIPDGSTTSTANPNHYLSVKRQYVISYNGSRKTPNWSAWELNASWLGSTPRQDTFRPDDTLPSSIPQASLADYSGSGYDRGHMCPSGDRTLTVTDNSNTFYLTNMVPQAANNNQGPWEQLEAYSRSLANSGNELFIISGPIYSGVPATIGSGAVAVPTATWKVITVLNSVGQGAASVTTNTRVIAVIMPNNNSQIGKSDDWHGFRVTVRSIESQTGLNIMSDIAQSVQDVIENRVDAL
jgi:endonuclease G